MKDLWADLNSEKSIKIIVFVETIFQINYFLFAEVKVGKKDYIRVLINKHIKRLQIWLLSLYNIILHNHVTV